jgi:hypothetical protein
MATWYYVHEGQRHGPVADDELRDLAARGGLHPDDLVWHEGLRDWQPARSVPGLLSVQAPRPWAPAPAAAYPGFDDVAVALPARRPPSEWPRRLTAPLSFLVPLLFFLLPWIDVHCNRFTLIRQSGLQSCFGVYSRSLLYADRVHEARRNGAPVEEPQPAPAVLSIVFALLLVAGLVLGLALRLGLLRGLFVGSCALAALAALGLQTGQGFPLEREVEKALARPLPFGAQFPIQGPQVIPNQPPVVIAPQPLPGRGDRIVTSYTPWLWLALLSSLAPLAALGLEQLFALGSAPPRYYSGYD